MNSKVIRVLTKLESRREELGENFNKELESVTKNQADPRNPVTERKSTMAD